MPKLQLHTKIVIGLILGAIFGAIFAINPNKVELNFKDSSEQIENWQEFTYLKKDSVVKTFYHDDQLAIVKYYKNLKDKKDVKLKIKLSDGSEKVFENVSSVEKIKSIGVWFKPIGDIFVRLLNMIAVPLVLASLIVGAASLTDLKHVAAKQ